MVIASLADRTSLLKPSPTLSLSARAAAMKADGLDVISFSAGEPDFNTPEPIRDAAKAALDAGFTKYVPTLGIKDLREAVARKFATENQLIVKPEQILVTTGAKQALYNAFMVLLNPGDEVLLVAPYWVTYADQILLAGGVPVVIHTTAETGFCPTVEQIAAAVTPKTKMIVCNSPNNPTGAVWSRETLMGIAELATKNNLWVISDEIYEHLVYGTTHTTVATLTPDMANRTLTVNGCSKSYAMTGWRIGYVAGPLEVIKAMTNLQDQVTSGATSFAQKGAVAALNLPHSKVEEMRQEFETRRDLVVSLLGQIPGLVVPKPKGAFYAFFGVESYLGGKVKDDLELSNYLLENALIAMVPGTAFGSPGHLRMSYATSQQAIREGVARLGTALSNLMS